MARVFEATKEQRSAICDIVCAEVEQSPLRGLARLDTVLAAPPKIFVHEHVDGPLPRDISSGLLQSPHEFLPGNGAVFLSGAQELCSEFASRLAVTLTNDSQKALYIPHAYADPCDVELLQDEFEGKAVVVAGGVYIRFAGKNVDRELVRGGFARMIGCYSVAWLLSGSLPGGEACAAIVLVFDGEGLALVEKPGQSALF